MSEATWVKVTGGTLTRDPEPWEARLEAIEAKLDAVLALLELSGCDHGRTRAQLDMVLALLRPAIPDDLKHVLTNPDEEKRLQLKRAVDHIMGLSPVHDPNGGRR